MPTSLPCRFSVVGSWIWKKNSSRSRYEVCSGSKMISIASACVAVVAVGRVRDVAAGVADPRREHARPLADQILHPPEAPSGEDRLLDGCVHVFHPPIRCLTMSNEGRVDVVPGQRGDSEIAATTLPSKERLPRSWSSLPSTTLSNVRRTSSPRSHPSSSTRIVRTTPPPRTRARFPWARCRRRRAMPLGAR